LEWNMLLYYYGNVEYFTPIWYHLWPFRIICGHLVHFSRFGMIAPRKIWQPWNRTVICSCKIFLQIFRRNIYRKRRMQ
jgi:hypothetical protein